MRTFFHPVKAVNATVAAVRSAVSASRTYRTYGIKPNQGIGF